MTASFKFNPFTDKLDIVETSSSPTGDVQFLAGNSGGNVPPNGSGVINVLGDNTQGIDIVGNAGTSTLTVSGINASDTQKGVASFHATNFTVTTGNVVSNPITLTSGNGMNITGSPVNLGGVATVAAFDATITQVGVAELATDLETIGGIDTTRIVTPDTLRQKLGVQTANGVAIGAGTSAPFAWTGVGSAGQVLTSNGAGLNPTFQTNMSGDVVGPASATDEAIARYDGTTGKLIQNSVPTIDNTGNVSITAAVSGANLSLTLNNTSNTASSQAFQNIVVGGGTAADPFTTYTVTGATNWSQGIDNSASDAYVLAASTALGTTNVISATTAGEVTMPLQPAFLAVSGADQLNVTGNNTIVTVNFGVEIFDQNNDYDGTNTFTCPVTGKCRFNASVFLSELDVLATDCEIKFTTSNREYRTDFAAWGVYRNASNQISTTHCILADMDAADTCIFRVRVNGMAADTVDIVGDATVTYFAGELVV